MRRSLVDPRTGKPIKPIGGYITKTGEWRWVNPILGASEDDGSSGGTGSGGGASDGGEGNDEGKPPEGGGSSDGGGDDGDKGIDYYKQRVHELSRENGNRRGTNKELTDKLAAAQTKLEEHEAKGRTELENAQKKLTDSESEINTLRETVKRLTVQNAFLTDTTVEWIDPADVFDLLNARGELQLDDDGKVKDLTAILKKLAEDKKHLVKSTKPPRKSGDANDGGAPPKGGASTDDALRAKYRI